MPPQLAALIYILFILYLFWIDHKKSDRPSNALWIPLAWMFLAGGRFVSHWLGLETPIIVEAYQEGSFIDAVAFFLLIAGGFFVLSRRKIDWNWLLTQNKWIWLYFLYCGISITWSDYQFVSFKRLIKELGNPIMVLVILTDKRPYEAIGVILKRLAFLWLPLSILFFKYYPALGRVYHPDGRQFACGVGQGKNDLGLMCLICGIYFSWNFLLNRKEDFKLLGKGNLTDFLFLGMVAWLLNVSQSATSNACLGVALILFFVSRTKVIAQRPNIIMVLLLVVVPFFLLLDETLGLTDFVLDLLGRDRTLTTRISMWNFLKGMVTNPFVGSGFQSFWLGERLTMIWERMGSINQAHNGYLEQYLNLGYIGVAFIGVIILSGLLKVRRQLNIEYSSAMLKLCFIVTAILYNYTEASFYGINNMWLLTLFSVIEIPDQKSSISASQQRKQ